MNDNPISLNMAPLADVVFCLCVFFMAATPFWALDGRLESWLPIDK